MAGYVSAIGGILGGLLGGTGSILGGQKAADSVPDPSSFQVRGFDPNSNPLLQILASQAAASLGFAPDLNTLMQSSPLNRLETSLTQSLSEKGKESQLRAMNAAITKAHAIIAQGGTTADAAAALQTALLTGTGGKVKKGTRQSDVFNAALQSAGFSNINDLLSQEQTYQTQAQQQTSMLGGQASSRAAARAAADQSINKLMTDYPVYGASDLDKAIADAMKPLNAQTLEQANLYGYNPAPNVALTQQQGIRDALAILGGRQGLANTALTSLQGALNSQNANAQNVAGMQGTQQSNAASLASQQATALNQLAQQGGMYQGTALGGSIAGAGAYLSDALSGLAQPGTASRSTNQGLSNAQFLASINAPIWMTGQ